MAKDERIALRIGAEVKAALVAAAAKDQRTVSSLVVLILERWLKGRKGRGR